MLTGNFPQCQSRNPISSMLLLSFCLFLCGTFFSCDLFFHPESTWWSKTCSCVRFGKIVCTGCSCLTRGVYLRNFYETAPLTMWLWGWTYLTQVQGFHWAAESTLNYLWQFRWQKLSLLHRPGWDWTVPEELPGHLCYEFHKQFGLSILSSMLQKLHLSASLLSWTINDK